MSTEYTEVITREAPGIEAYKLGLMELAKNLISAPPEGGLPAYQVAGQNALEQQAMQLAQSGVGAFAPLLGQAGQTMQRGVNTLGQAGNVYRQAANMVNQANLRGAQNAIRARQAVAGYDPYQRGAAAGTVASANIAADASRRGQAGIADAIRRGNIASQRGFRDLGTVMGNVRDVSGVAGGQLTDATARGRDIVGRTAGDTRALGQGLAGAVDARTAAALGLSDANIGRMGQIGQQALGQADMGMGQAGMAQMGMGDAAAESMRQALQAQGGLREASQFGLGTAMQGIGALGETTGAFDPRSVAEFLSPYDQTVIDQTMADLQRASDIAGRAEDAAAVQAGAFGGSRRGIMAAERGRNLLEQQGRVAAQLRSQGFAQAQQAAQQAFEQQQARRQQAAQLTGSLGQAGAGTALQAAQAGGQLGLQGTDAAMRAAQQGGALGLQATAQGLQATQLMGQLEADAAKLGISTQEMGARLGIDTTSLQQQAMLETGRMGLSAEQQAAANAAQQARIGLDAERAAADAAAQRTQFGLQAAQQGMTGAQNIGQMGLSQAQLQGNLANQLSNIGQTGAQLGLQSAGLGLDAARLGMQGAGMKQNIASGIGALGQAYGALGTQQGNLAQTGQAMQTQDINNLMGIGQYQRGIDQSVLDATRQTALQDIYEPYQRIGFYSDILRGAPSTQSSITATTSPQASLGSQLVGAAGTAVGLGGAASRAGFI